MGRILVAAVLGIAVGAAAATVYLGPMPPNLNASQGPQSVTVQSARADPELNAITGVTDDDANAFTEEVAVYQFASDASLTQLIAAFTDAVQRPVSRTRGSLLVAIVSRLAELDADRALALLRDANLDVATLRNLGSSWLETVGTTAEAIEEAVGLLPGVDGRLLRLEAIAELAAESPEDALAIALGVEPRLSRVDALRAIAEVMAEQDPYAALAFAESIPDDPSVVFRPGKQEFQAAVLRQLARVNLVAAIEYINRNVDPDQRRTAVLARAVVEEAQRADPLTALEIAQQTSGWVSSSIEGSALERLARQNPASALAYADSLPLGQRRQNLRRSIAMVYGETDPTGALAWLQSLDGASEQLANQVLQGIARTDPLQALEIVLSDTLLPSSVRGGGQFALGRIMGAFRRPNEAALPRVPPAAIAERLFAINDDGEREQWLREFVDLWSRQDATAALDWLNTNRARVSDQTYLRVARNLAETDPETALRYSDQVAPAIRDEWVSSVAMTAAGRNGENAAAWISQFRGEPMYETIAVAAMYEIANQNVVEALNVFNGLSEAGRITTAGRLAGAWAREDAVSARGWIAGMPTGEIRDSALSGYLSAPVGDVRSSYFQTARRPGQPRIGYTRVRSPEPATLALFSSDTARQEAILSVVGSMVHYDPGQARILIDTYVSDPALLSQAERTLQWAAQ